MSKLRNRSENRLTQPSRLVRARLEPKDRWTYMMGSRIMSHLPAKNLQKWMELEDLEMKWEREKAKI